MKLSLRSTFAHKREGESQLENYKLLLLCILFHEPYNFLQQEVGISTKNCEEDKKTD
jgi:hypothetical protein